MPIERGADHQGALRLGAGSAATAAGSKGGSTMAKLVVGRIGERQCDRAVVIELHDAGDGDERRIKSAGAGGDDDVAALERISTDLERPDVDGPVAAPLRDHRDAAAKQPSGNDVSPVGHEQDARGQQADVDDPADQPSGERTGMPMRTPSLDPADSIAKRRGLLNEEPTMRPSATPPAARVPATVASP